ncbi:MAG: RTX toxin [bacterium]|nr:RTX toxin [Candidatus Sumerlaeota bacterium]
MTRRFLRDHHSQSISVIGRMLAVAMIIPGAASAAADARRDQLPQPPPPPVCAAQENSVPPAFAGLHRSRPVAPAGVMAGAPIGGDIWIAQGPGPISNGQTENFQPNNQVAGSVTGLITDPGDANIVYAASTNGGVWKTANAAARSPFWTPLTSKMGSLSMSSIKYDPADAFRNTIVAGIGRNSALARMGGRRLGILRTTDGGANWNLLDGGGTLTGANISGVAARGSAIIVSVDMADDFTYGNIGIWRSTDTGASFEHISGDSSTTAPNGLYGGRAFDLQGDPNNNAVLYTAICDAGENNGVYKSGDTGATWVRVSDDDMNSMINDSSPTPTDRIRITVGTSNNLFAGIVNKGCLAGVFRSGNGGASWQQMELPGTIEGGAFYGIHVGGQGYIHFSLLADPQNANIVYIGGDRQPGPADPYARFPNSIGALNYTGRLFRGDASQTSGSQWQHMTHSRLLGAAGGGTVSSSAPHADSRDMAMAAGGALIEAGDGGISFRTSPRDNNGDWFSLCGNLQVTEAHDAAYDAISNRIMAGTQDVGAAEQLSGGSWNDVVQGDGGDVAVDDRSLSPSQSIRYFSSQYLGGLRRRTCNAAGDLVTSSMCGLDVTTGSGIITQFYTPLKLNRINPVRIVIGARNSVYESPDQGDSLAEAGPGIRAGDGLSGIGLDYGGYSEGAANPDVIYAAGGFSVYVRTSAAGAFTTHTIETQGDALLDVVMNRGDWHKAYAVTAKRVYYSANTGKDWTDITGNLAGAGNIRRIEFIPLGEGKICAGTQTGVYLCSVSSHGTWNPLGTNLPVVYVFDLEYNAAADTLTAGTLGRGIWTVPELSKVLRAACGDWPLY